MQVNETTNEGLKRAYTITVGADEIDSKVDAELKQVGAKVNIPGFRRGKAPMSLLRQRYGDSVLGEVLEKSVHEVTEGLLRDKKLRPAAQPQIEVVSFDKGQDMVFSVNLELLPDIAAPDFSKIKIERPVAEVTDAELDKAITNIAEGQNSSEVVTSARKSKSGDIAVIDFVGSMGGVEFPGGAGQDHHLELGSNAFIPGFEDQLIGTKAGDDVTVKVAFPVDYHAEDLAGKDVEFAVKVKELRQSVPAKIDDGLAKVAGKETLAELKDVVKEQLAHEYARVSREKVKQALLDALANAFDIELPQVLVDAEFDAIWEQVKHAQEHGHGDPDDEGKSEEQLREDYMSIAQRRVKLGLLLTETGRANKIEVTQQDLNSALMREMTKYPGQEQAVIRYYTQNKDAMESLRAPVYEDKVVDFILELANVTDKTVSVDDLYATDEPAPAQKPAQKPAKKAAAKKAPAKKAAAKKVDAE